MLAIAAFALLASPSANLPSSMQCSCRHEEKLPIFMAWLEGCGGWLSGSVKIGPSRIDSDDVSIFATRKIPADSILAIIPWECVITPTEMEHKLRATGFTKQLFKKKGLHLLPLAFLLWARREHSVWRHYINMMPDLEAYKTMRNSL